MSKILHGTLTPSVVTTLTVDAFCQQISIVNRTQAGTIWFTVDGSTPSAGGADVFPCLGSRPVAVPLLTAASTVKLFSTVAADYSVIGETQ